MIIIFKRSDLSDKSLIKTYIFRDEEHLYKFNNPEAGNSLSLKKFHNIIRIPNNTIMLKLAEIKVNRKFKYPISQNINRIYYKVLHEGKTFYISNKYFIDIDDKENEII